MNRTSIRRGLPTLAALVGVVVFGAAGFSQPSSRSPLAPPANGPRKSEPGDGYVALTNAVVHVSPGTTVDGATVVMRAGKIESVTPGSNVPEGADARDCTGMHIYAGFIEPYFEVDVPKPDPSAPGTHWNSHITPQRSALDKGASGIASREAETLRSMGFVAAAISPRGGIFRGSSALVSLAQLSSDPSDAQPRVYVDHVYQCASLGRARDESDAPPIPMTPGAPRPQRQPDDAHWSGYPNSQMGSIALVRQTLSDADWQQNRRATQAVAAAGDALDSLRRYQVEASAPSAMPHDPGTIVFDVDDELEALRAAKICKEFNRECTLLGSGLEFRRLDAIAATKLPIVLPLAYPRTPRVGSIGEADAVELKELVNWEQAPTNPRRLDAAGLTVALTTSKVSDRQGGRRSFKEHLSTAIKSGLKPDRALAMLTTNAAKVLGVSDQFGTVEKGKAASLIVADGELFTDKPDAPKKGEPGYVRAGRIVDVWIDGRRHPIAAKQRRDLGGTWDITLTPGPKSGSNVRLTFEIDDDFPPAITIVKRSIDEAGKEQKATTKAQGVTIEEDGRLRFTFDHEPFGEKGVFVSSGVIEKGEDGQPVLRGESMRAGGQFLRWDAKRTSTEIPKPVRRGRGGGGERNAEKRDGDESRQPEEGNDGAAITREFHGALEAHFDKLRKDKNGAAEDPSSPAPVKSGETAKEKDSAGAEPPATAKSDEKKDAVAKDTKTDEKSGEPKRSKTPESDAIAAIPEKLGLPLGAYAVEAAPTQGMVVITGATIWTSGPTGNIENGVVVIGDGKIRAIGKAGEVTIPTGDGVRAIDASGKHITPGIIDCHSHTGISKGVNESGQAVTAEVRIGDVTDPDSISWYRQLAAGVTTVNSLHGSANPIGGQNQVNKNRWGCVAPDDMHFAGAIPGIKFALGENVKQSNAGDRATTRYPQTRMGVETLMRDRFTAAKEYLAARTPVSEGDFKTAVERNGKSPRRDLELEALGEIIEGKRLVHCHSYRQDEILMLCRIADEFGFKIGTFQHGLEVYKVADVVKEHAIGASLFADWWAYKVEVQDAIPYAGPLQTEVGVLTSYNSDSDELARRLNSEAGKAVKYSHGHITSEQALKFVTINPAKQLKIDKQVGSIEVGKDADIAVWSGPPLSSLSRCERTFVDGREMFSLEKDAAMREKNASERARIIQKVLASRDSGGGPGAGGRGRRGEGEPDSTNPTDVGRPTDEVGDEIAEITLGGRHSLMLDLYRQADDLRRERFLDLLSRRLDPRFHTAGQCGCEGN